MDQSRAPMLEALAVLVFSGVIPRWITPRWDAEMHLSHPTGFVPPPAIDLPSPEELQLESDMTPGEPFFGPVDMVPLDRAVDRVAAEQLTPYPPGIPVVVPGERLDGAVLDYLHSGLRAGMALPDATDPTLDRVRVVAE